MKKKQLLLGGILLISILSTCFFFSCDKDTWCYLEVTVTDQTTNMPVPGAHVRISMDGTIDDRGLTNENGIYTTKFAAPAIFNVQARVIHFDSLNPQAPYFRQGVKSVRLKESETVQVTTVIESDIHRGEIDNWEI